MARGWRYAKPSIASAPLCVTRLRICAMHPFYLWVPCLSVHPTYPFWYLLFCYYFLSFCRFCLVFVTMLSLELCRHSSDIFLSSSSRTGLTTSYTYYWIWLRPDRLMSRTHIHTKQRECIPSVASHASPLGRINASGIDRTTTMTGPDCMVVCNLINTHTHTYTYTHRQYRRLYVCTYGHRI